MTHAERDAVLYATTGKLDKLVLLLDGEVVPDAADDDGNSLLMIASSSGRTNIVEELIRRGANVNHRNKFGRTAYMLSKGAGHADISEMLLPSSDFSVGYDISKILEIRPSLDALFALDQVIRGERHRTLRHSEKLLIASADLYSQADNDGLLMVERCGYWIIPASRELFSEVGCDGIAMWLEKAQNILDSALANGSAKADPTSGTTMFLQLDEEPREKLAALDDASPISLLSREEEEQLAEAVLSFVRSHISEFSNPT